MRGWMRLMNRLPVNPSAALVSALLLAAGPLTVDGALAQNAGKPAASPSAQQPAPQGQGAAPQAAPQAAPKTMAGSPLAQVPFEDQPFPLQDDGTYKEFLNRIASDVGRRCGKLETYGWEFRKGDQDKMDHIFQSTMDNFSRAGWVVGQAQSKSVPDPETTVYMAGKENRKLLMLWVPMADAAMLMLCETEAAGPKK